jgi:hypothetical protein
MRFGARVIADVDVAIALYQSHRISHVFSVTLHQSRFI